MSSLIWVDERCETLYPTFGEELKREIKTNDSCLWSVIWRTVGIGQLVLAAALCLLYKLALIFCPIVILARIISHFEDSSTDGNSEDERLTLWLLDAGLLIFPVIGAFLYARSNLLVIHLAAKVKGLVIGAIFRKMLLLSCCTATPADGDEQSPSSIGQILTVC